MHPSTHPPTFAIRLRAALTAVATTLAVATSLLVAPAAAHAGPFDPVAMSTALRSCVNTHFGRAADQPVTEVVLANLDELSCREGDGNPVDDLTGLEFAQSLTSLRIEGAAGADGDLRPLRGISTLRTLSSSHFGITDLSPVSGVGLAKLSLTSEPITDAREISRMTALETLQLLHTPLTSPPDLSALVSLRTVDLRRGALTSPPDLRGKPDLTLVDLSSNALTSLPSFEGSPGVVVLNIGSNQISDLGPLAGLDQLRTLNAPLNRIADLRPVGTLLLTALDVMNQRVALPTVLATASSPLPPMAAPNGSAIEVTVSEYSTPDGSVDGGAVTWNRPGAGLLVWDQVVAYSGGAARFSGQLAQTVVLGTLTTGQPVVNGTPAIGIPVTAKTGTWGPAPVNLKFQWLRGGAVIPGATAATYTPVAADGGLKLAVRVYGSKAGHATAARQSSDSATVLKKLTAAKPTVSGTAAVGSVLTVAAGTWAPAPVALGYQWNRDGAAIPGATATTYTAVAADAGAKLTVTVTGTKSGYAPAPSSSDPTAIVTGGVLTATKPIITGSAVVGQKLLANAGTWGPTPVTLVYQWRRAGATIAGATASSYTLTSADLGATITVAVVGAKPGFTTRSISSNPTSPVKGVLGPTPAPTISGDMTVGSTLTATPGGWGPDPVVITFQWFREGEPVPGTTTSTYTLSTADAGSTITVTITGSKPGYDPVTQASTPTPAIVGAVLTAPQPVIQGQALVGSPLVVKTGTWGPAPVSLSYQWKRGGVAIPGATGPTYMPVAADLGIALTVSVAGSKPGYPTRSKGSAPTAPVGPEAQPK